MTSTNPQAHLWEGWSLVGDTYPELEVMFPPYPDRHLARGLAMSIFNSKSVAMLIIGLAFLDFTVTMSITSAAIRVPASASCI